MFAFLVQVLQLSHISFLSSVPEGSNMKIDVSTGMAYVHVSPPTIKTLTACLMSLAPVKVLFEVVYENENEIFSVLSNVVRAREPSSFLAGKRDSLRLSMKS